MFEGFETAEIETGETNIFTCRSGTGPAVLLLHGFPQSHLMWCDVAPLLARQFTVVCADLRGYGRSGCPASAPDHEPYAKRAMARDMVAVMDKLGFPRFAVAGHDRGARVAYRLALDHPERVSHLAVLDIVPTGITWQRADARFAQTLWPWSLLAQREPLPERLLQAAPEAVVAAFASRDTASSVFGPQARAAYIAALRDPARVHAMCEDYRAGASLDPQHDEADQKSGRRIACPVLALWSARGITHKAHGDIGGPLAIWRTWANRVEGHALEAGHFFPEEIPDETAAALERFFSIA